MKKCAKPPMKGPAKLPKKSGKPAPMAPDKMSAIVKKGGFGGK